MMEFIASAVISNTEKSMTPPYCLKQYANLGFIISNFVRSTTSDKHSYQQPIMLFPSPCDVSHDQSDEILIFDKAGKRPDWHATLLGTGENGVRAL